MRRLAAAVFLLALVWLPTIASPPAARAAVCTGWTSASTPPATIRVLRTATGAVETVDFKTYVKVVMAAEWPDTWPREALRAGAIAIKQYAWYFAMHYRGGTSGGNCYDVVDSSNDQVYSPETRTPTAPLIAAVEDTWSTYVIKNGVLILTGYRPGSDVPCGSDSTGSLLQQRGARNCALAGLAAADIMHTYFDPIVVAQVAGPPVASGTGGSTYVPLTPKRILDTRDGTGGLSGPFSSRVPRTFTVVGADSGVPAGAMGVTGILTVTQSGGPGFIYIGPAAVTDPTSSSMNFPAYDDRANSVNVMLGSNGSLSITYASSATGATAQILFDITGYYSAGTGGSTYVPLTPKRILDTRDGTGGLSGPFSSRVPRTFTVVGADSGVPAGAMGVTGILTVTQSGGPGFIYIGPAAVTDPTSSSMNFPAYDDRANSVNVMLGSNGSLSITYASSATGATAQILFDITGYYSAGTGA
jgi:serine protease inhibitor ecotin